MFDQTNTIAISRHLSVRPKRPLSSTEQVEAELTDIPKLAQSSDVGKAAKYERRCQIQLVW